MPNAKNTTEEREVKIVWKGDREVWVGKERIYLGEDNIFYITAGGEMDEKTAIQIKKVFLKLLNMAEGKVNYLIDLTEAKKQSPGARKIWKEMSEHEKTGKLALFGMHPLSRVLASFVMEVTKKKDMKFFKTKEKALAWLNS